MRRSSGSRPPTQWALVLSANEKGDATATVELKDAAMYITPGSETNGNAMCS